MLAELVAREGLVLLFLLVLLPLSWKAVKALLLPIRRPVCLFPPFCSTPCLAISMSTSLTICPCLPPCDVRKVEAEKHMMLLQLTLSLALISHYEVQF
jgi:hypothetical protein